MRDGIFGGVAVHAGRFIALVDEQIVATDEAVGPALSHLIDHLLRGGAEVMTVLLGSDDTDDAAIGAVIEAVQARRPELEVDVHAGDQPHYPALVSVE